MTLILNGTDNSATTPAVTGTDTDTGVYYPAANQVAIATSGTQAMLANASQGVQFANAIGVGATTPTTSGAGITFPATQSSSTNANTLDDYEEGFWTPSWNTPNGDMSVSYSVQSGRYTKIGRMVYLTGYLKPASISSQGTGQIVITGLPFAVVEEIGLNVSDGNALRNYMSSTQTMITGYGQNTTQLRPGTMGSGGNSYGLTTGSLTTDFFLFSAYYPSS